MTSIRIHEFKPDIYPYRLWVAKSGQPNKWINDRFKSEDGYPLSTNSPAANALTFPKVILKETNKYGVLVILKDRSAYKPPVVAHEAIHAANDFFSFLGIDMSYEHDEHYAYLVMWIVNCIWQVITEKYS